MKKYNNNIDLKNELAKTLIFLNSEAIKFNKSTILKIFSRQYHMDKQIAKIVYEKWRIEWCLKIIKQ